jgi:hypothetical protein
MPELTLSPQGCRTGTPGYMVGGPVRQPKPELTLSPMKSGIYEFGYWFQVQNTEIVWKKIMKG